MALNVGLDFDDVIVHTNALKPQIAKELFGVEVSASRWRREFVVATGVLTEEQYVQVSREAYLGKYEAEPVHNALESIESLVAYGHRLRIVTSRSFEGGELPSAMVWMQDHNLSLPVTGVGYGLSKAAACEGLDIFVDDDPKKLHELSGVVPHLLFFVWEHNTHEREPEGAIRVHSWQDIMFCISKINNRSPV